jgi:PPOX class probable F420-dependent enzyme
MVDFNTKLGAQAAKRLKNEHIIWLTTTSSDGTPQPNPVWFYWDGEAIIVYSQPSSHKLRNIRRNPKVALNLHANEEGGDIVVITGVATLDEKPKHDSRFIDKYREYIPKIGHTPETLAQTYSVQIRIVPNKLRGF